jgi:hypothetical protein
MLISINKSLIGKVPEDIGKFNDNFENVDLDVHQLAAVIDKGYAICAQHEGARKGSNVTGTGFLAVDIDEGLTIEAAEADPYFRAYASILYTTASHTPESPRFRIVFELESALTDSTNIRHALTGLVAKFGGDRACTDACRLFFGNPGCNPRIYGNKLPPVEVERLIERAQEKATAKKGRSNTGTRTPVRSRLSIPVDTQVRTAAGEQLSIWDVPEGTRVYCPEHVDTRPSAFVAYTRGDKPCIFCSACDTTFFPDGFRPTDNTSYFDYNWDRVLRITTEEYLDNYDEANNVSLSQVRGFPIDVLDQRYLPDHSQPPAVIPLPPPYNPLFDYGTTSNPPPGLYVTSDLLLIKSPKGTGKTELLAKKVTALKAAGATVLVVSHRRSLLFASAARLGLTNYMRPNGSWHPPTRAYSICLDSIGKLKPRDNKYDVVIIDECEQVFSHLLSSTMRDVRRAVLTYLRHYLREARQAILLDADLSKLTVDIVAEITRGQVRTPEVIINRWKPAAATVQLYDDPFPNQLVGDLVESLSRGERCYVCSNSKRDIDLLAQQVPLHVAGRHLRMLCITSDNSQDEDIQHFIQNITTEILNYDVIFTSPSMSTGIDITFPDGACEIDAVFGIFHPLITTHLEIDQQLSRVRNPGRQCVWVTKDEFSFETDPSVIKAEILASEHDHHYLVGVGATGQDEFLPDPLYDTIYSSVTAMQRASTNALRRHFIKYKEENQWTVSVIPRNKEQVSLGAKVLSLGRAAREVAERQQVLAAMPLDRSEYEAMRRDAQYGQSGDGDAPRMRRYEIEAFYDQEVDAQLLEFDDRGRGREAVRNLYALLATDPEMQGLEGWDSAAMIPDRLQWGYRKQVLGRLLRAAGLLDDRGLISTARVDSSKLGAFDIALQDEKAALQRLFDVSPRRDCENKPVRQLSDVLQLLGLRLVKVGRDQTGGTDRKVHALDPKALATVMRYVERRKRRYLADPES